mmetsp:Transcript_135510/g.289826  ORF Transcript_135510/g.289826 Transcript_135510/m.289826 type:complete len:236 (-) Transcript_135510:882-1589(-)
MWPFRHRVLNHLAPGSRAVGGEEGRPSLLPEARGHGLAATVIRGRRMVGSIVAGTQLVNHVPVRTHLVTFYEGEERVDDGGRNVGGHQIVLDSRDDWHGKEHACNPQQCTKYHHRDHHHDRMHAHELPAPCRVHVHPNDVRGENLDHEPHAQQDQSIPQALINSDGAVKENRRDRQQKVDDGPDLRDKPEKKCDDEEEGPQFAPEARHQGAHHSGKEEAYASREKQVGLVDFNYR